MVRIVAPFGGGAVVELVGLVKGGKKRERVV